MAAARWRVLAGWPGLLDPVAVVPGAFDRARAAGAFTAGGSAAGRSRPGGTGAGQPSPQGGMAAVPVVVRRIRGRAWAKETRSGSRSAGRGGSGGQRADRTVHDQVGPDLLMHQVGHPRTQHPTRAAHVGLELVIGRAQRGRGPVDAGTLVPREQIRYRSHLAPSVTRRSCSAPTSTSARRA